MKAFVRRNFAAVLGVALPLLLIAVVLTVHGVSRWRAEAPAHPVLYVAFSESSGQYRFKFPIDARGRLALRYRMPKAGDAVVAKAASETATLALYDAHAEALSTFVVAAPEPLPGPGEAVALAVPDALAELRFRAGAIAPDGYRFEVGGWRSGGLFRELFGAGGRDRGNRLARDGIAYPVPELDGRRYANSTQVIGWVVDGRR